MTIVVIHSTPSDSSFSATGATAWDATHTLSGVGTMAGQDANAVAITGGSISGVSGLVASVTGTAPVVSSGGTTPAISLAANYGDTQNPYASKTANYVLAAPNGAAGAPVFRAIVVADIPTLNQNTTGTAANITASSNATLTTLNALSLPYSQLSGTVPTWNQNTTGTAANVTGIVALANGGSGQVTAQLGMNAFAGAVTSGSYLRGNGTNVLMSTIQAADVPTLNQNTTGTAANVTGTVAVANGGTGATTAATARTNLGASTVGGNMFTLTNPSAITFPQLNADNTVSALDAATFRTAIGAGTSSTTGTVTSVATSGTVSGITLTGGTITTTGTVTLGGTLAVTPSNFASQTANTFLAAPNGAAGAPTFRAVVAADIPTLNQNTTGTASNITATSNSTLTTLSALSLPGSQISGNISGNAVNVTGTVAISNGGSGATTAQGAINAFAGAVTSGSYLRGNGTNVVMNTIQVADVPTLNQNTTGTASNVTGIVAVSNGGTGTATPALVAGTNVTISGTWPNQTINSTASGGGTVTSVAATVPNFLSITGSPITSSGTLAISYASTPTNGQLLIGNGTGFSYSTLTAGSNITITNSSGGITIASTGGGGSSLPITKMQAQSFGGF